VATRISTYLHQAQDFSVVDGLLRHRTLEEIEGKRFAHKHAFLLDGVLVELFLIERDDRGLFTSFWAKSRHDCRRMSCRRPPNCRSQARSL